MTSTTMTRPCDVAVVNNRSMHSEAKLTAVSKPNVEVVLSRSLSIVLGTPTSRRPASCSLLAMVIEPSPPTVTSASMPCSAKRPTSSSVRSTSLHVPSVCCTGYAVGLPRFVVPMMVPPWWVMPRTDSRTSRTTPPLGYCCGLRSPLKPSRMPTTSQPRLRAASVAARMTAFNPGASPPPVLIAMREMAGDTGGLYRRLPARRSDGTARSGTQQHPPERLAALDVGMRRGRLRQREHAVDDDLQLAGRHACDEP